MTNGTSQGLFVVVAIVIFGIFVLISYLLFRDNLKPSLSGIFTDGLEQSVNSLDNYDGKNHIGDELTITRGYVSNYLRDKGTTPISGENSVYLKNKDLNIIELTSEEASEKWNYSVNSNTITIKGIGVLYKNVYSKSLEKYLDEETQNATFTQKITGDITSFTYTHKFIDRKSNNPEGVAGLHNSSGYSIQLDKEYTFTQTLTNNYSGKVTQETYKFKFIINDNK
ncbi:hypothetical protein [Enterococcus xiangfangensis]|uniref:Uncharacterized protein n=1 Tax=Enterococcus xiangfangensis TaxID=1296537 RepID=A0ABU3FDR9_9ENTE|nr:hypothetical protein [Enterococcus xiangfangensis]MDT2760829.1 hypothetical protein [Enterococcus xiangfangensis]